MAVKDRGRIVSILFILAGLVIGGLIGNFASGINGLGWLAYGEEFGLRDPIILDLNVITLTLGLTIRINIASIIGVIISLVVYRKV
ncbi:MAG: DUF4321 domain-containing protein [Clostridia bacterium]|nr:DUF4321 domain-containing protein [Clostridia bacterium]